MLRELWIENYALVEKAHIVFNPGFTVLTGETGTGKSLIVGGLDLALGARSRPDTVRSGAPQATIAARFEPVPESLQEEAEEGSLLISRRISAGGKSRVSISDQPATLRRLRAVGARLADLHGQHEQQTLLQTEAQRRMLDAYAQADSHLKTYRALREQFLSTQERLRRFLQTMRRGSEERDFWAYQLEELKACRLRSGQEVELIALRRRISGIARIQEALTTARDALEENSASASRELLRATQALERAAAFDATLDNSLKQLEEARVLVEDAARDLAQYQDAMEGDPEQLELVEEHLARISTLRRKHHTDEAGLIALEAELSERLGEQENASHVEREITEQLTAVGKAWVECGRGLSRIRTRGAARLSRAVSNELHSLGMAEAAMRVVLTPATQGEPLRERILGAHGLEGVAYHLEPNPGEPGGPLSSIASGGELSRVMLALKNVLRKVDPVPVVLFDEIDTGIGGLVAEAVGARLSQLAETRQVIVVTHSALIAGMARHHLRVSKQSDERTSVKIEAITGTEREKEIARMLAGSSLEAARPTAKTLLRERS